MQIPFETIEKESPYFLLSVFNRFHDNVVQTCCTTWEELGEVLQNRLITASKDNANFSGAVYFKKVERYQDKPPKLRNWGDRPYRYFDSDNPTEFKLRPPLRSNDFVEYVRVGIFDFDGEVTREEIKTILEERGWKAYIYSTYSHTNEHEKFRVVILFSENILSEDWFDVWLKMHFVFQRKADAGCKDLARIQYLPETYFVYEKDAFFIEVKGCCVDIEKVEEPDFEEQEEFYYEFDGSKTKDLSLSWNDFDDRVSSEVVLKILLQHGYKIANRSSDKTTMIRPNKNTQGISGTIGHYAENNYFNFSSDDENFGPNKNYTPSKLLAILVFDKDFKASAKYLKSKGFGKQN